MAKTGTILAIDDNEDLLLSLRLLLKQHYATIHCETSPERIPALLKNEVYDVILLDMNFTKDVSSGEEGFFWLDNILHIAPSAVVVLMTAYGDMDMAIKAIKHGATDFVLKPWENEKLLATVSAAMKLRSSRDEIEALQSQQTALKTALRSALGSSGGEQSAFIGQSEAMRQIHTLLDKVAKTDANVLILGENGTGKEVAARELHRRSARANEVFISVDMGAISENLFESELFGHVRGAYTDAKEDRAGRFEIASGGTLFLDEIGNLSLPLQAKLLTVLQNRTVTRVGSHKPMPIDIRLICATNMPLYEMVEKKQFRQDLLYRINTVELSIPPLRKRVKDIALLAEYFLRQYCTKYRKPQKTVSQAALKKLQAYPWRGNVRELQHTLERVVIMTDEERVLQPSDFLLATVESGSDDMTNLAVETYNLEELEKLAVRKALSKHHGNVSHAAEELGLTRAALYRRMEKYGL